MGGETGWCVVEGYVFEADDLAGDSPLSSADQVQAWKDALTRRLHSRSVVAGEISLPAVPSMLDDYVDMCSRIFADLGRKFGDENLAQLRAVLKSRLSEAFMISHRSNIVISYHAPVGPT